MRVDPPLKIEKIFFAFLDELDHSTHFKNCMEIDLGLTPSPPTGMEISIHFFFFLTLYSSLNGLCTHFICHIDIERTMLRCLVLNV